MPNLHNSAAGVNFVFSWAAICLLTITASLQPCLSCCAVQHSKTLQRLPPPVRLPPAGCFPPGGTLQGPLQTPSLPTPAGPPAPTCGPPLPPPYTPANPPLPPLASPLLPLPPALLLQAPPDLHPVGPHLLHVGISAQRPRLYVTAGSGKAPCPQLRNQPVPTTGPAGEGGEL